MQLIPYQLANNDTKLSRNSGAADDDDGFIPMGTIKEVEDLIRAKSQPIDASAKIALRPLSIAVSSYHFLVLRGDRIQFISNLNGSLVQEELLSSVDGIPLGLIRDSIKNSTWLYTTHSIFQVCMRILAYEYQEKKLFLLLNYYYDNSSISVGFIITIIPY